MLEVYWNWFDDEIVVFDFCRENGVLILYRPCWKLGYQASFATTKLVSNLCKVVFLHGWIIPNSIRNDGVTVASVKFGASQRCSKRDSTRLTLPRLGMLWIPFASSRWSAWHRSHCVPVKGGEDKVSKKDVTVIFYIFFMAPRIVEPFFAEDQAGRVRVATAENKAAAAKVELEALQRVEASERTVWDGRKWQYLHLMVPKISPTRKPEDLQGQTVALSSYFKTRGNPADFDMDCGTTWQLC